MKPIKVLHMVGSLRRGGIETWLVNLVRQARPELRMDFLLSARPGESGDYERIVQDAGCRVFHRRPPSRILSRLRILGLWPEDDTLEVLLRAGNYDVLHVHANEFNGDTMRIASKAGTPVRVAHCHSTLLARGNKGLEMVIRRLRHVTLDRWRLLRHATDLVACGRDAGRLLAGSHWLSDPRSKVVYCGVPLDAFTRLGQGANRAQLLARHNLAADALVVGHAGSMGPSPVKNHAFLLRAFEVLSRRDRRYHLLLAGDGPLRPELEALARQLGVSDRVRFTGLLSDVPAHMAHLFDVHVLPSLAEGLPVVAIEAAASGLYTVMSENVTDEIVEHLPGRIERVSLDAPLAYWADRIERGIALRETPAAGAERVGRTPLSMGQSAEQLIRLYQSRLASARDESEL